MVMAGISQAMSEYSYSENDNTALDLSSIVCMIKMYLDVNGDGILSPDNQERMDSELSNRNEIIKQLNKYQSTLMSLLVLVVVTFLLSLLAQDFQVRV
ncbi:hypothetical protein BSPWISOXPB_44 [uncultured Gammaproteobacteria bacterium]|nr:hypothetical protein BSPWISOXPB_44 [uncultured Gammaproteobacteria bacterium]